MVDKNNCSKDQFNQKPTDPAQRETMYLEQPSYQCAEPEM